MKLTEKLACKLIEQRSPGGAAVMRERFRQIDEEGYDKNHDLQHKPKQLIKAGYCYVRQFLYPSPNINLPVDWPWRAADWKPKHNLRDVERSAALLVAGLDAFKDGL